jgi:hypothetical protein
MRQGQPLVLWNYTTWYHVMPCCSGKMTWWMILGESNRDEELQIVQSQ